MCTTSSTKTDEAWREEYRKKQAAGVKFEFHNSVKGWIQLGDCDFIHSKERYREVEKEVEIG